MYLLLFLSEKQHFRNVDASISGKGTELVDKALQLA